MKRSVRAPSFASFSAFLSRAAYVAASGATLLAIVNCGGAAEAASGTDAGADHDLGAVEAGTDAPAPGDTDALPPPQCQGSSAYPGSRPVAIACSPTKSIVPVPGGEDAGTVSCTTASDCSDAGHGGACLNGQCSFDQCLVDTDCPAGQACGCADQFHGNAIHYNACVPAQCRVDSDCGNGKTCSPATGAACGSFTGYQCHTVADTCTTDADCCSDPAKTKCVYQPTAGHFECQAPVVCSG
jgi:Cys-rich repeat protein